MDLGNSKACVVQLPPILHFTVSEWERRQRQEDLIPRIFVGSSHFFPSTLSFLDDHHWCKCVELKTDILVVLLFNFDLDAGLYDGSQGVVQRFVAHDPAL